MLRFGIDLGGTKIERLTGQFQAIPSPAPSSWIPSKNVLC
jgi:hypothetical protein